MTARIYILTSRPRVPAAKLDPLYPLPPIYFMAFSYGKSQTDQTTDQGSSTTQTDARDATLPRPSDGQGP